MKLLQTDSRSCGKIFFFICLLFCGLLAWKVGEANALKSVWVAREKIAGAAPYTMLEQINVWRGALWGIPTFLIGTLFSVALSRSYFAALNDFRGERL